jgi:hypothetical protein
MYGDIYVTIYMNYVDDVNMQEMENYFKNFKEWIYFLGSLANSQIYKNDKYLFLQKHELEIF